MPVLASPVPLYATTAQASGPDVRTLTRSSPGTTDSTATVAAMGLAATDTYLRPEQSVATTAAPGPLGAGVGQGWGWALAHNDFTGVGADDAIRFAAGTWTLTVHYSRPGGLLTGNISNVTITAILLHVDAAGAVIAEIGRGSASGITITTTEASSSININGAAAELLPGHRVRLELHVAKPAALAGDDGRFHTNSTTALRATAVPAYARIPQTVASSNAAATVIGAAQQTQGVVASANGQSATSAVIAQSQSILATASGVAEVDGKTARVRPVIASSAGTADMDGIAAQVQAVIAGALGTSAAEASAAQVQAVIAEAQGEADVQGSGGVVVGTVASAIGTSEADGRTALVIGTVGTVEVGQGGGQTTVINKRILIVDDA